MFAKHLIDKALITLEVGNATALFILLAKDGTIHRKGDGNPQHVEQFPLMMGISHQGHFEALMMTIDEAVFNYAGVINQPNRMGVESRLTMIFQGPNELDYSFRVVYGSESEGPPGELVQILINAVKITQSWYQEQLAEQATEQKSSKWKFWE